MLMPKTTHSMGVITPSGNTVVEQVTIAILRLFPQVACHFSRSPVFGKTDPYPESYDWDGMLGAATLLAHTNPDLLVWNGSKAGQISFALDEELAAKATRPLTSSTLALKRLIAVEGWRTAGLITPYLQSHGARVEQVFASEGLRCSGVAHAGLADNLTYASMLAADIIAMAKEAASAKPDVLIAWCTNLPAAPLVADIEQATGLPMVDSTSVAVFEALYRFGIDTKPARSWGSLFG